MLKKLKERLRMKRKKQNNNLNHSCYIKQQNIQMKGGKRLRWNQD